MWIGTEDSRAQSGGVTGYAFRMGPDPIGQSMGNSLSAWSSQESSALYNPALAVTIRDGVHIHPSSSLMSFDRTQHSLQIRFPLPPSAALSLSILHFGIAEIDGRTPSGYPTGSIRTSDFQLSGAFGISISDPLKIGIGIKWNRSNYHPDIPAASSVGLDFGVLYRIAESFSLALVLQDLFASYSWNSGQLYGTEQGQSNSQAFARRIKLASHFYVLDQLDFTSEVELRNQQFERRSFILFSEFGTPSIQQRSMTELNQALLFRQGIAWEIHPILTFRTGIETTDLQFKPEMFWSTGFSLYPPMASITPGIHYAYRNEPGQGSAAHAVSFTFSF